MIFGRKKRQDQAAAEPEVDQTTAEDAVVEEPDHDEAPPADRTDEPVAGTAPTTDHAVTTDNAVTADSAATEDDSDADAAGATSGTSGTRINGVDRTAVADETGETDDGPDEVEVEFEEIDAEALDAQDWRTAGPWDSTEVDEDRLVATEDTPRIDLGSLILTGTEGMELQLQVADETQQIVSAMMIVSQQVEQDDEVHDLNSALEVAAFAAPRTGGFWSEIRDEMIEAAEASGGTGGLAEGPFGVEVRRLLMVETPDGEQGYQPSRMWVVEGPRWILRGVVYGHAALEGVPGDHVERIADMFKDIVVRRGDEPMAPGDLLVLSLPENMVEEATEEPA